MAYSVGWLIIKQIFFIKNYMTDMLCALNERSDSQLTPSNVEAAVTSLGTTMWEAKVKAQGAVGFAIIVLLIAAVGCSATAYANPELIEVLKERLSNSGK